MMVKSNQISNPSITIMPINSENDSQQNSRDDAEKQSTYPYTAIINSNESEEKPMLESERINSTERNRRLFRNVPVPDSPYNDVWKRVWFKLKVIFVLRALSKHVHLYGHLSSPRLTARIISMEPPERKQTFSLHEVQVKESLPFMIIHPNAKPKIIWNIIIAFGLIYCVTVMPFTMAFYESNGFDCWFYIDMALNVMFFIDIVIQLFSAYYDTDGILVSSRFKIILRYVTGWFAIDVVSCIPFGLFGVGNDQNGSSTNSSMIKLLRLPKLYRLARITRLAKMMKHYKHNYIFEMLQDFLSIKHTGMRLFQSFFTIMLCVHVVSCIWYYSAKIQNFSPDTWVFRGGYLDSDVPTLYITCIYWAVTTVCGIGYGDITAVTDLEMILCIFWMLSALYFVSFTVGSLSSMLNGLSTKENVLTNKLAAIDEFATESKLTKGLKFKLRHALKYSSERTGFSWGDKNSIFNELPKHLRYEVALAMHHGAVKELVFFEDKDPVIVASIVPFLQPMFVNFKEYIYKKDEFAEEIYFLIRGRVSYICWDEAVVYSAQKGSYFGDVEVIYQIPRKYNAKAIRSSELLIMGKSLISTVRREFPGVWDEMTEVAEERDMLNEKTALEIKEYNSMSKEGKLFAIDPANFKDKIEKKLKMKKAETIKKRITEIGFHKVSKQKKLTLGDLYTRLESAQAYLGSLEKHVSDVAKIMGYKNGQQSQLIRKGSRQDSIPDNYSYFESDEETPSEEPLNTSYSIPE
ncbi:unnamed protein product [Blepharisma stoltei]|uniref:Cyclic nucleotide-binding domain-containing protein n=1 Tax=Blepharisma stoltei TaxID=1481888 RepID=A0AAU9J1Q3_9CILI|nr:unnamed protein product [Blepharisma stoltei]